MSFPNTQAHAEGWAIFDCSGTENGRWQLQKDDELDVFPTDEDAWLFVHGKAEEGSVYHQQALGYLCAHNHAEWKAITAHAASKKGTV